MVAHRRSDRHHDDLCADGLRKRVVRSFALKRFFISQEAFQIGVTEMCLVFLHRFRKCFEVSVYVFIVLCAALVSNVSFSYFPPTNCPIAERRSSQFLIEQVTVIKGSNRL